MQLEVRYEGDPAGTPVVLLHGFPQTVAAWDAVWPRLAEAGYRVLLPTQRGYSATARPPGRAAYRIGQLLDDVVQLVEPLGPVHLVGHDWGGGVAWTLAARRPELLRSLTVLSTPHPRALGRAAVTSRQALMSWYILLFQLPVLPERALLAGGGARLRAALRGLPADTVEAYLARMREPGALTAALNWYRALPLAGLGTPGTVTTPTLYVWGERDPALGRVAAERTADHVSGPYEFLPLAGAGHWLPERHADELLPPLLRHLSAH